MIYIFLIVYLLYIGLRSKKNIHMLQQNFYNESNRYLKWIFNNKKRSLFNFDWFFIILLVVGIYLKQYILLLLTIFYVIIFIYYRKQLNSEQSKKPLVITSRVKRIIFTMLIVYLIPSILFVISDNYVYYVILGLMASLNSIVIYLVNIINKPVEKIVYLYYFNQAKSKIKVMNNMPVIGITGSYGKTSSKNILSDILSVKHNALPTPQNYNTPYGLMLTINNKLDKFTELFIAEMGAFEVGQIKSLCNFVKPKYGIITKIGIAHLDSFKTEANIQKTKFELVESLPSDGVAVLNRDDENQISYNIKNKCQTIWIGIDREDVDVRAININYSKDGTNFDCIFKNDLKKYHFETKLLGQANIYNILAGIALAKELGMTTQEITRGVKMIKPVEHRLQIKKQSNMTIIDDAYNSNPVGSKMALETLKLMPGFKIVVTPGMIELKDKQYELNYEFGKQMIDVADIIILVGTKQTKPIQDSINNSNYDKSNVYIIDDVKEAFKIINNIDETDKYVLLENDLPDIFNE